MYTFFEWNCMRSKLYTNKKIKYTTLPRHGAATANQNLYGHPSEWRRPKHLNTEILIQNITLTKQVQRIALVSYCATQ